MLRRLSEQLIHYTRDAFDDPVRGLRISLAALALLILLSTLIYMLLEGMSFTDALYMVVITITTVGFGEVRPLSPSGRVFTIILILLGVGTATGVISNGITIIAGPHLWAGIRRRSMERHMAQLEKHYIVCGYGRMGQQVIGDLQARQEPFVVIDLALDDEEMLESGINYIIGDATQDETLHEAGIDRAYGLVAALDSDSDNVMTVLTAREMNPKLFIVARVTNSEVERKLRRAGANRVVSPYQIGGHRLALALVRPAVNDFLDRIYSFTDKLDVDVGQVYVAPDSPLAAQTVGSSDLREKHGVSILAIQQTGGEVIFTPPPTTPLEPGATLIVIGPPDKVYEMERATRPQGRPFVPDDRSKHKRRTGTTGEVS